MSDSFFIINLVNGRVVFIMAMENVKEILLAGPIQIVGIKNRHEVVSEFDDDYQLRQKGVTIPTLCFMIDEHKFELPLGIRGKGHFAHGHGSIGNCKEVEAFNDIDEAFGEQGTLCYCRVHEQESLHETIDRYHESDIFYQRGDNGFDICIPSDDEEKEDIEVLNHYGEGFGYSSELFTRDFDKEYLQSLQQPIVGSARLDRIIEEQREKNGGSIDGISLEDKSVEAAQEDFESGKITLGQLEGQIRKEMDSRSR